MQVPLKVYLDSSDFSVLSDPVRLAELPISDIRAQLFRWRATGEVEFFYSVVHVVEASAVRPEHTEKAVERSRLMYELCGLNVLDTFPDILRQERLLLLGQQPSRNFFRTDGKWVPYELTNDSFSNLARLRIDDLKSLIAESHRSKWEVVKEIPSVQESLLAIARAHLNKTKDGTVVELMKAYSVSSSDAEILREYQIGEKSREELLAYMRSRLQDPTFFIQMRPAEYNGMSSLFYWMRESSASFHRILSEVADRIKIMCEDSENGAAAERWLADASTDDGLRWNAVQLYETIVRSQVSEAESDLMKRLTFDDFIRLAPGSYSFVSITLESIMHSFAKTPRRHKQSDMGDLLHSFYAPYVDVYRTDGYMAPIAVKYVERFGTTVVGKLAELTDTIKVRLQKRALIRTIE